MRIGMSLTTSYPRRDDSRTSIKNLMARVELMAELDFDSLSLGDHHLTRDHYFQVLPTMSRLSAHAGTMRLIPLFLLPFYNPLLLAEQLATLDVISDGRVTVICCLGYQPEVHDAFQIPQTSRVSRFVEAFEILQRLWTEDMVTFQGKHYAFQAVSINPKPVQQPLPRWIGAGADPAIRRTARLADAWVISPGWTPGFIEEKLHLYRTGLQEYGRSTQVTEVVLRRDLHLATTADIARREAQPLFDRGYRGFDRQALAESLIVGGPAECIRYLEHMQRLGITHVLFRCALQDQSLALQTIRLIGTEVIPHFRASSAQG
jgi:alkanesulfonate monooxygenase SsuD/methylene tetrahydromethanopterin reductase-like flavin-dependent oxidoreductase (luciferase family)